MFLPEARTLRSIFGLCAGPRSKKRGAEALRGGGGLLGAPRAGAARPPRGGWRGAAPPAAAAAAPAPRTERARAHAWNKRKSGSTRDSSGKINVTIGRRRVSLGFYEGKRPAEANRNVVLG